MAAKKKSLGKGLANIYGDDLYQIIDELQSSGTTHLVDIEVIRPNPYQPRTDFSSESLKELADSIATHGIFNPVLVREALNGYELIAGERRVRAAKLAGLSQVPAIIAAFDDRQMMEISLLENIQREDLNVIEEANAYQQLLKTFSYTQEALGQRVNKSRTHITNILRLLKLPKNVQSLVSQGKLTMGHVRPLITVEDQKRLQQLAETIVKNDLSVRQVEALVKGKETTVKRISPTNKFYQYAENLLAKKLQTTVRIANKQIVIKYSNDKDLNRLLEVLDCLEE